jgi:hypothetical protein
MNTDSIETFTASVRNALVQLKDSQGTIPCPNPQPWNKSEFQPKFDAPNTPRAVVPLWRFSSYPYFDFDRNNNTYRFTHIQLSVNVSDATMGGRSKFAMIKNESEIEGAIQDLIAFRDVQLNACRHMNYSHVANLGRCYNRYRCNDCGMTFEIDSGD